MKVLKREHLSRKEGILLRKLFLTQYHENILFKHSAPIETFIEELRVNAVSDIYIRKILSWLIVEGAIIFHKSFEGLNYYYINEDILSKLLRKDTIFKLDEEIINNKYYLLEK